jgi:hypothetical protein
MEKYKNVKPFFTYIGLISPLNQIRFLTLKNVILYCQIFFEKTKLMETFLWVLLSDVGVKKLPIT